MHARDALRNNGHYYSQTFASPVRGLAAVVELAKGLGTWCGEIISTNPSPEAGATRPFDRREALGWHSDFTTHTDRPRFSLSYISQQDPRGSPWGDWRVAQVRDILDILRRLPNGSAMMDVLALSHPFEFDGGVIPFPVLETIDREVEMRFYGEGIRRGYANAPLGSEHVSVIAAVEAAAEQCATDLAATTGAVLVVDNRTTLHYRREQTVKGPMLRRAYITFAR